MKKVLYITMLISATVGIQLGVLQASAIQDGFKKEKTVLFDLPNPVISPLDFSSQDNCIIVMPSPGAHLNDNSPTHTQENAFGVPPFQMSLNDNALAEQPSVVPHLNSNPNINNSSLLFTPPFCSDQK
jgi:hypothetical protein